MRVWRTREFWPSKLKGLPNSEKMILGKCYLHILIHLYAKGKLMLLGGVVGYPVFPLVRDRALELIHHSPPRRNRNRRPNLASCCPHLFCICISFENLPSSVVRSVSPFFWFHPLSFVSYTEKKRRDVGVQLLPKGTGNMDWGQTGLQNPTWPSPDPAPLCLCIAIL